MAWNQPGKGKQRPLADGSDRTRMLQRLRRPVRRRHRAGLPLLPILVLLAAVQQLQADGRAPARRGAALRQVRPHHDPRPQLQVAVADRDRDHDRRHQGANRSTTRCGCSPRTRTSSTSSSTPSTPISDPRLFLFGFRDDLSVDGRVSQGRETLQNAAESAVREVVGNNSMDTVLFERSKLIVAAREHLQESLDMYQTGLRVTGFNAAERAPAGRGQAGLRRRHQRARGQEPHRERGRRLRQQDRARGARRRVARQGRVRGLPRRHHRQRAKVTPPLPLLVQRVPQGARGHAQAPVPGDHAGSAVDEPEGAVRPQQQHPVPAARRRRGPVGAAAGHAAAAGPVQRAGIRLQPERPARDSGREGGR